MTPGRGTLVVAAHRGPVQLVTGSDGTVEERRGSGGLVTALRPLVRTDEVTWVAAASSAPERLLGSLDGARDIAVEGGTVRLRTVVTDEAAHRAFYETAANPVLWFVHHGLAALLDEGRADDFRAAWEGGYATVGEAFVVAVAEEARRRPGARVLLQDYHLLLAPAALRARLPDVPLAHFTHIPWPSPGAWWPVPDDVVRAIHASLLACDSIGFHVPRWRDAFVACCEAYLGRGAEAAERAHANPIAIDPAGFEALAGSPGVQAHLGRLQEGRPQLRILRVDRTDPAKNALRGIEAYERLLERRPGLRGRVQLLALLDPSRQTVAEYRTYRSLVEAASRRVEERFGLPGRPALVLDVRDDFPASVAAYLDYDVLLANSVRDGMNLVALEAPLVNRRDGVVVLSSEAGAHDVLGDAAISVDPHDVDATADALERALELAPAERRVRARALREAARARTTDDWIADGSPPSTEEREGPAEYHLPDARDDQAKPTPRRPIPSS